MLMFSSKHLCAQYSLTGSFFCLLSSSTICWPAAEPTCKSNISTDLARCLHDLCRKLNERSRRRRRPDTVRAVLDLNFSQENMLTLRAENRPLWDHGHTFKDSTCCWITGKKKRHALTFPKGLQSKCYMGPNHGLTYRLLRSEMGPRSDAMMC